MENKLRKRRIILPTAILCTLLCIGLGNQPGGEAEPTPAPAMTQEKATATPTPEIEIKEQQIEVLAIEAVTSTPVPTPTPIPAETPESTTPAPVSAPPTLQPVQAGDMVYVPGFGWVESQGEGTVIYDEIMYENGNKVGSMG